MKLKVLIICTQVLLAQAAYADADGKVVAKAVDCGLNAFSALDFICKAGGSLGDVSCKKEPYVCGVGSQEIFTGLNVEIATPAKYTNWTGFGAMGELYQLGALCALRDLKTTPLHSKAEASIAIGKVKIDQNVQFSSWDPITKTVEAYQVAKTCAPVIGCIDFITSKITFRPRVTDLKGSGKKVGEYDDYSSHSIDVEADAVAQGLKVTLPALDVNTPYGQVSAKPEFGFGRAMGFVLSAFDGNTFTLMDNSMGKGKTADLYGRVPGVAASAVYPTKMTFSDRMIDNSHIGWLSPLAFGSRDASPKTSVWVAGPTPGPAGPFPVRPDEDLTVARSKAEKVPNVYLGANVKVTYDPIGMLPDWILSSGFIQPTFQIFAKPTIDVGFTSQLNILSAEHSKWDAAIPGDYRPHHLNQAKSFKVQAGTSAAARFALDAGVDLTLKLHIPLPWPFDDIDKNLIDIHPRTTLLEANDKGYDQSAAKIDMRSEGAKVVATKEYFQTYLTSSGPKKGLPYIAACLKAPAESAPLPSDPTYEPGNPEDLLEDILYPCNICVGMNDEVYKDPFGTHTIKGFLTTYFPSDINERPDGVKWTCDQVYEVGCYDMCKWDQASGKLSVVKTVREMLATGEIKNAPARCR